MATKAEKIEKIKDDDLVFSVSSTHDGVIYQVGDKAPDDPELLAIFKEAGRLAPKKEVDKLMRPVQSNLEAENIELKQSIIENDARIHALAKTIDNLKAQIANLEADLKTKKIPIVTPGSVTPKK